MDGSLLKSEKVRQEAGMSWEEHPSWLNDDRKRWGLALARVRAVLLARKNNQNRAEIEAEEIYRRSGRARNVVPAIPLGVDGPGQSQSVAGGVGTDLPNKARRGLMMDPANREGTCVTGKHFPDELDLRKVGELETWVHMYSKRLIEKAIHEVEGWIWDEDRTKIKWDMTTKEWISKIRKRRDFTDYLNTKWGCQNSTRQWSVRWSKLWSAAVHHSKQAWIWRFLQRGYFTGSRGKGWNPELKTCDRCGSTEETLEHVFWQCQRLGRRIQEGTECGIIPTGANSLLDWLDYALAKSGTDSSYLWAFGVYLVITWEERNNLKFRGKRARRPLHSFLRQINLEVDAFPKPRVGNRTLDITCVARERVQGWMVTWAGRQSRGGTQTDADYLSVPLQEIDETQRTTGTSSSMNTGSSSENGPTQDEQYDPQVSQNDNVITR
ncbi:hypothetical protein R1sor_022556 [Riccia sorocarpa]|uniref:Reverse transcriptase zinc-binding domain-containing protein n=1 Tax=Riccia sorocarpa TaxID=122646 RepID=A0ABD3GNI7_9MARC